MREVVSLDLEADRKHLDLSAGGGEPRWHSAGALDDCWPCRERLLGRGKAGRAAFLLNSLEMLTAICGFQARILHVCLQASVALPNSTVNISDILSPARFSLQ